MKRIDKEKKGITLIALIITIIVLLILAGVTIIALTGENGILKRTSVASEKTEIEKYKEQIELEIAGKQIEKQGRLTKQALIEEEYIDIYGEIEKDGYVYIINEKLEVTYSGKALFIITATPDKAIGVESATVTINVIEKSGKIGKLEYAWSISNTEEPTEGWIQFQNDEPIVEKNLIGTGSQNYLWIKAYDMNEESSFRRKIVGPYYDIDIVNPTVVLTKSNIKETDITINIIAKDDKSGIAKISLEAPNGETEVIAEPSNLLEYITTYVATNNGTYTVTVEDRAGNITEETIEITGIVATIDAKDGIMATVYNTDLEDGEYYFITNEEKYRIKLINYYDNVTYATSPTLTTTLDGPMLVLKYHLNLTINTGVILRPTLRTKGMYICVLGTLTNNGTISMTARGASATGQNVYLVRDFSGSSFLTVPKTGSGGGARTFLYGYFC